MNTIEIENAQYEQTENEKKQKNIFSPVVGSDMYRPLLSKSLSLIVKQE